MRKESRLSVILAAYRAEAFIAQALGCLLAQRFDAWELVIGADDFVDYVALLAGAGLPIDRVRQARTKTPASGPSAARNAALAIAGGDLVAALDADDLFDPERLGRLAPIAVTHGVAVDRVAVVTPEGAVIDHAYQPFAGLGRLDVAGMLDCGVPLHPVVRRDLVGEGWPVAVRFSEDSLFNLQVMTRNQGLMVAHPAPLYRYVVRAGSLAHAEGSAAAADAAYAAIIASLSAREFDVPDAFRAEAIAGYQRKRALNRRFAAAAAPGLTFQAFRAATEPTVEAIGFRPGLIDTAPDLRLGAAITPGNSAA